MMSVEDRMVIAVLGEQRVQRINFRFGPVRISGHDYSTIARGIRHTRLSCEVNGDNRLMGAGSYVHGTSATSRDVIRLPFMEAHTPAEKALIVHEATHAIEDYHRATLHFLDSEGAAFLAQTMYGYLATNGGCPFDVPDSNAMDIFLTAHGIARRILTTPGGYEVFTRERESLRNAIARVQGYHDRRNQRVHYNGI